MNREALCRAVGKVAWGYVLIYLNINIGTVNILPNWAGCLLFIFALDELGKWEAPAGRLRPLGWALFCWELLVWLLAAAGIDMSASLWYLPQTLAAVLSLWFNFQLLTHLAAISDALGLSRGRSIRRLRNFRTVLTTALSLPWGLLLPEGEISSGTAQGILAVAVIAAAIVLIAWTFLALFGLRSELKTPPETEYTEAEAPPENK